MNTNYGYYGAQLTALNARLKTKPTNDLVINHLPMVLSLVKKVYRYDCDVDDLVGVGNLALVRASKGYDPDRNVSFYKYAESAINRALHKYVKHNQTDFKTVSLVDVEDSATENLGFKHADQQRDVSLLLKSLSTRQREVIHHRYLSGSGKPKQSHQSQADTTFKDTAKLLGVSHTRVQQIEAEAILKMRKLNDTKTR